MYSKRWRKKACQGCDLSWCRCLPMTVSSHFKKKQEERRYPCQSLLFSAPKHKSLTPPSASSIELEVQGSSQNWIYSLSPCAWALFLVILWPLRIIYRLLLVAGLVTCFGGKSWQERGSPLGTGDCDCPFTYLLLLTHKDSRNVFCSISELICALNQSVCPVELHSWAEREVKGVNFQSCVRAERLTNLD